MSRRLVLSVFLAAWFVTGILAGVVMAAAAATASLAGFWALRSAR
jgi:hypothetical protein